MGRSLPADLVALANLVHAPSECPKGGEENGRGAGPLSRDPTRVANGWESPWWRSVLQQRHLLDAHHPGLLPYRRLRHPAQPVPSAVLLVLAACVGVRSIAGTTRPTSEAPFSPPFIYFILFLLLSPWHFSYCSLRLHCLQKEYWE